MMTLHIRVSRAQKPEHVVADVKERLKEHFGIAHATVEVEFDACADNEISEHSQETVGA